MYLQNDIIIRAGLGYFLLHVKCFYGLTLLNSIFGSHNVLTFVFIQDESIHTMTI